MSGAGRRGRRGGRRQRRREEQARQSAARTAATEPQETNGPSGPAQVVIAAPAVEPASEAHPVHPRPMSARELVARMEALRAQEAASAATPPEPDAPTEGAQDDEAESHAPFVPLIVEPVVRRFQARGAEWLATVSGRGAGGTGRVAPARIEAIRFSTASEPDSPAAEVLMSHARLDDLYDEELAELLERGLRMKGGNG